MLIDPFYWTQPQPRIVQFQKRRYALRLESVFWQQLEKQAKKRGIKLGQLIAELDAHNDVVNLSSFVRGFCMVEAEKENTRYRLSAGSFDLVDVLRGCPAPAVLLNENRIILETNQSLLRWIYSNELNGSEPSLRQIKFDDVFIPRTGRSLDDTVELIRKGELKRAQFQINYQRPGQPARIAQATMSGLMSGSILYILVWVTTNATMTLAPTTIPIQQLPVTN